MNVLKLAIYGGAAYLAYNYLKKRKAQSVEVADMKAETTVNPQVVANEELIVDSAMQQMGEEGLGVAYGNQEKLEGLAEGLNYGDNNWDSDNLSSGI